MKFTIERTYQKPHVSIYRAFYGKHEVAIVFDVYTLITTFNYVTNDQEQTQAKWDGTNFKSWVRNHIKETLTKENHDVRVYQK